MSWVHSDYKVVQVGEQPIAKNKTAEAHENLKRNLGPCQTRHLSKVSSQAAEAIADVAGLRVVSVDPLTEDIPTELRRVADVLVSVYRETIGKQENEMRSSD